VSTGSTIPNQAGTRTQEIEVRVTELGQLFNAIDPSPFRERDLDPRAEEFIVAWGKDVPADAPLALVVYLDRPAGAEAPTVLHDAIHEYFGARASDSRRTLRELFGRGRISLAIGLSCLGLSIGVGDAITTYWQGGGVAEMLKESLLIGGWVAMWRPIEVFLYDWWPIRAEARLLDRLAAMPVRIEYPRDKQKDARP
jgi:hypothetical protein